MLDRPGPHARGALREARELERHGIRRTTGAGSGSPDAGAMRQHDVALERREIRVGDADRGELPEAGVDAVDRVAPGDDGLHGGGGRLDGGAAATVEREPPRRDRSRASSARGTSPGTSVTEWVIVLSGCGREAG